MTKENKITLKTPVVVYDKKFEQFKDKILFPEKLAKAKDILPKGGLPKRKK